VESYAFKPDPAKAQARYQSLGSDAEKVLTKIVKEPGDLDPNLVGAFASIFSTAPAPAGTLAAPQLTPGAPGAVQPTTAPAKAAPKTRSSTWVILPILCVLVLVAGAVAAYFFLFRNKKPASLEPTPIEEAEAAKRQAAWTDYSTVEEKPISQFMASYKIGDDLFDDSFSIDSPTGEFLGECGVGISESIGVGDPKKVTAFEVWLFDKNDIQTVTKVLMSAHAFNDPTIRQRLDNKGAPVLAEPNSETTLETQSLLLKARVVNMGYGQGAMPPESYFDHFVLELAVWPKK
jgi:hypothetical protein